MGLLGRLPNPLVAALIQGARRVSYPARAVVPNWELSSGPAIVLKGCLRVFIQSRRGSEQVTLRYIRPGDMIGTFAGLLQRLTRSLEAVGPSELLQLEHQQVHDLLRSEPIVTWAMVQEFDRMLQLTNWAFCVRALGSIRIRVASEILTQAESSGGVWRGREVVGTQQELANAAGTAREVVAGTLQDLKREGVIEIRRGRVVVLDPERLSREADGGLGLRQD